MTDAPHIRVGILSSLTDEQNKLPVIVHITRRQMIYLAKTAMTMTEAGWLPDKAGNDALKSLIKKFTTQVVELKTPNLDDVMNLECNAFEAITLHGYVSGILEIAVNTSDIPQNIAEAKKLYVDHALAALETAIETALSTKH